MQYSRPRVLIIVSRGVASWLCLGDVDVELVDEDNIDAGDPRVELGSEFRPARKRIEVSVGDSVRIIRELQELSQNQLSVLTGIPQATISAIENGRVNLGVERAKVLARALNCHPAVLLFPGWDVPLESAA
jgi:DNA-binding XRE family transcriptional regulator